MKQKAVTEMKTVEIWGAGYDNGIDMSCYYWGTALNLTFLNQNGKAADIWVELANQTVNEIKEGN